MPSEVLNMIQLVKAVLISFRDTDFSLIKFESLGLAVGAGLFLFAILVFKLLWGRNKFGYVVSGHNIPKEFQPGTLAKLFSLAPKILLTASIFFALVSLANPYLPRTTIEELVESRERIDLVDVSSSKGWEFENTGKSAGQLGREAYLKFLTMRKGQNDRASLWLFSTYPVIIEDFVVDDDIYFMSAEDAPYVMTSSGHIGFPENDPEDRWVDFVAPRDKIQLVEGAGSTKLNDALAAVIKYFDSRGNRKIRQKALLIETDAAVEDDAATYLQELKKRNVKVYLLHMKPHVKGESQFGNLKGLEHADLLKKRVKEFGGEVFDIQNKKSLENAYRAIDKLEKTPISLIRNLYKVFIFQRPLMTAFCLLLLALVTGCLIDLSGENP